MGGGAEQGGHPSPAGSSEKGLSSGGREGGNSPSLLRLRNNDLEDLGLGIPEALWGLEKEMLGSELREGERVGGCELGLGQWQPQWAVEEGVRDTHLVLSPPSASPVPGTPIEPAAV